MKFTYTRQTNKYILKNFLYIFPFALIPALFLSLSMANGEIKAVLTAFFTGNLASWNFMEVFHAISVLNFASWKTVLAGIAGTIVIVPCIALFTAFLEKHMRIGKRTFNGLLSKLNDNIASTFIYIALILVTYEIWSLLLAALLYLLSMIPNLPTAYVFIILVFLASHVVLLYALGTIYLWLPCMQITGFPVLEALQYAHQLVVPVRWVIFLEQFVFLLVAEITISLCSVFIPSDFIFTILMTALITILLMYYVVRMQTVYFDRDNIERMDLKKY